MDPGHQVHAVELDALVREHQPRGPRRTRARHQVKPRAHRFLRPRLDDHPTERSREQETTRSNARPIHLQGLRNGRRPLVSPGRGRAIASPGESVRSPFQGHALARRPSRQRGAASSCCRSCLEAAARRVVVRLLGALLPVVQSATSAPTREDLPGAGVEVVGRPSPPGKSDRQVDEGGSIDGAEPACARFAGAPAV